MMAQAIALAIACFYRFSFESRRSMSVSIRLVHEEFELVGNPDQQVSSHQLTASAGLIRAHPRRMVALAMPAEDSLMIDSCGLRL